MFISKRAFDLAIVTFIGILGGVYIWKPVFEQILDKKDEPSSDKNSKNSHQNPSKWFVIFSNALI